LVRLCFNRKNKTLGAIFRQSNVLKLLEENYNTFLALRDSLESRGVDLSSAIAGLGAEGGFASSSRPSALLLPAATSTTSSSSSSSSSARASAGELVPYVEDEGNDDDDEAAEMDDETAAPTSRYAAIKERVTSILTATEFIDKRSSKLSIDDFLRLLASFNEAGIHFT